MPGIGRRLADEHEHELDVDFEVIEDPEDPAFPRLPNVVSHRGHRVLITATVHDLPEPDTDSETTIKFSATVNALESPLMGERGHVSHPFAIWGTKEVEAKYPSQEHQRLPFKVEILVPMIEPVDEHLGQGPDYEALVNVTTDNTRRRSEAGDDGQRQDGAATERVRRLPKVDGSFLIRFASQ